MPSLRIDSEVDSMVKVPLIYNLFKIVGIGSKSRNKRILLRKKSMKKRVLTGIKFHLS